MSRSSDVDCSGLASLPTVPDPLVPPLRDNQFLLGLIVQITGQAPEVVAARLRREHEDIGANVREQMQQWQIEPYVWSDRLFEFYRQTDAFLYESLVWNRTALKNRMRQWIAAFLARRLKRPAKVLTYGDGLGFDSLYLALAGHAVGYFEVSADCVRFARAIFDSAGVSVQMLSAPEQVQPEGYDAVICLDVLEHVPDPRALVGQLASAVRPGGWLIAHAPFYYVAPKVPTHLRVNQRYSGDLRRLYAPHGLDLVDGRAFWDPIALEKRAAGSRGGRSSWRKALLCATGLLLAVGRHWATPHVLISEWLARPDQRRLRDWPEHSSSPPV